MSSGHLKEVVVYERFELYGVDGVMDRRLLMGGGRLRQVVAYGGQTVLYIVLICLITVQDILPLST